MKNITAFFSNGDVYSYTDSSIRITTSGRTYIHPAYQPLEATMGQLGEIMAKGEEVSVYVS